MDNPLLGPQPGIQNYRVCVALQFLKSYLDWLSIFMILPLLAQYCNAIGGDDSYYSVALTARMFMTVLGSFIFGVLCDRGVSMNALYVGSCIFCMVGNLWYAAIDAFVLRTPVGIIVSIAITGLGASSFSLLYVYLARVCTEQEYGMWLVATGFMRSAALFTGPLFSVGLEWAFNTTIPDEGGSFIGAYALPGTALALGYLVLTVVLFATWRDVPLREEDPKDKSVANAAWGFVKLPHAIAMQLITLIQVCCVISMEVMIPVYAWHQFGWKKGTGGAAILSAASVALVTNQIIVTFLTKRVADCFMLLLGCLGGSSVMLITIAMWSFSFGVDTSVSQATARSDWLSLTAPSVLYEGFAPWQVVMSMVLWGRLVRKQVPQAVGTLNAVMSALVHVGSACAPTVVALCYKGGIPYTLFLVIFSLNSISSMLICVNWKQLKPR